MKRARLLATGLALLYLLAGCTGSAVPRSPNAMAVVPAEYSEVPRVGPGSDIQAPKAMRRVEPLPPPGFVGSGRTVTAAVEAVIAASGKVEAVWFLSGDHQWGDAVAAAVRHWQFEPATRDGKPIAVRFVLTSSFKDRGGR